MDIMAWFIYVVPAAFLAIQLGTLEAKPADTNNEPSMTTGRFVRVDQTTGRQRSLHREDIEMIGKNDNHHLRLHFEDGSPPIGIHVTQGSVWNRDSRVVVRRGPHRLRVPHVLDGNCFLHGAVTGQEGAVNINRCGKVTANIQTRDHYYHLEEHDAPEGEGSMNHTKFKVTKRRHSKEDRLYDEEAHRLVKRETENKMADSNNNGTVRRKRQIDMWSIDIELAIFLDANFVSYLYHELLLDTEAKMRNWIIAKWNVIQGVYSDPEVIGAHVTIELKLIEIWWINPLNYPDNDVEVKPRLTWFCQNTPESNNYDLKVLYTKNVAGHQLGLAWVGTICIEDYKCFLVKSPTEDVFYELHEMGHSIGFPHDPNIGDCDEIGGFMGWGYTNRYLPCYRRVLRRKLSSPDYDCLFEENVGEQQRQEEDSSESEIYWLPPSTESPSRVGC